MTPMLFMNIAWMRAYRGLGDDQAEGKFRYMREGGVPHEIFNFLPTRGRCYGYAPIPGRGVNLRKLGASPGDTKVDDILVVWTATHPDGGRYIIGWYDGARVYAKPQERPKARETREFGDFYYSVTAAKENCRLLSLDERVFPVPTMQKGYPGISASFYPDNAASPEWTAKVRRYIETGVVDTPPPLPDPEGGRQVDPEHRQRVEKSAIERVTAYYEDLDYDVISREADNLGWDLEARRGGSVLRLEVKGLSGAAAVAEVTPNEYKAMTSRRYRSSYRLCIVTNALANGSAKLQIFGYDHQSERWLTGDLEILNIAERVAARVSVGPS